MSLNFTTTAERNSETPSENSTKSTNGIKDNNAVQCSSALVATITNNSAVNAAID